mgnify:FL=1
MITILDNNNKLNEHKNNIVITYPRTANIIFGSYPYPDQIHNFILDIKNNLNLEMKNYTNVKGGMTDWNHFIDKKPFNDFIAFLINKNQLCNPELFQYFLEKYFIKNAWGNEIKKGDSLKYHIHSCWHGILYLTEGCDLILPELNIKITPKPGNYYIFPPQIKHGFDTYNGMDNRYSLIFNIEEKSESFNFYNKINE